MRLDINKSKQNESSRKLGLIQDSGITLHPIFLYVLPVC